MAWVRIDDQFADHPKLRAVGAVGKAIQVSAFCFSNRFLTDGFLSFETANIIIRAETKERGWPEKMVKAGLWDEAEGGYLIHDYLDYNPTKEEVLARREQSKTAAKLAAKATNEKRWGSPNGHRNGDHSGDADKVAPTPLPIPKENTEYGTPNGVPGNFAQILADWNQMAAELGYAKIDKLTPGRKEKLKTRSREPAFDFQQILKAFKTFKPEIQAHGERKAWKPDFDYVIRSEDTYTKILEGRFRTDETKKSKQPGCLIEDGKNLW
jgi:hypothetical protein